MHSSTFIRCRISDVASDALPLLLIPQLRRELPGHDFISPPPVHFATAYRLRYGSTLMMHSTIDLVIPFLHCLVFCIGCGCTWYQSIVIRLLLQLFLRFRSCIHPAPLQLLDYVISFICSCIKASYRSAHSNNCASVSSATSFHFDPSQHAYVVTTPSSSLLPSFHALRAHSYRSTSSNSSVVPSLLSLGCHHSIAPRMFWFIDLHSPLALTRLFP